MKEEEEKEEEEEEAPYLQRTRGNVHYIDYYR